MNWLYIGAPLALSYLVWYSIIISKKKWDKYLLIIGLAHIPYLIANLVAPFRGLLDGMYAGYSFGLIQLPQGPWVTIVVGAIVLGSLFISSKAILNDLDKLWEFTFVFDLMLTITMAFPVLLEIIMDPMASRIQLGEYLTISGFVVALIVMILFSGPTFFATYYAGRRVLQNRLAKG